MHYVNLTIFNIKWPLHPFCFCNLTHLGVKQDIPYQKNVGRNLIVSIRNWLNFEKWAVRSRMELERKIQVSKVE